MDWIDRARRARIGLLPAALLAAACLSAPAADRAAHSKPLPDTFQISSEDETRAVERPVLVIKARPADAKKTPAEEAARVPGPETAAESATPKADAAPPPKTVAKPWVGRPEPIAGPQPVVERQIAAQPVVEQSAEEPAVEKGEADPRSAARISVPPQGLAGPAPSQAESLLALQPVAAFAPQGVTPPAYAPSPGYAPSRDVDEPTRHELPWGPSMPSAELDAIAGRAEETARQGFNLAERGALYTARARFVEALRTVAQALDAQRETGAHTKALAAGLRAIEEVDDFVPTGDRLETDLNFRLIIDGHRTSILKERDLDEISAAEAQRTYLTYAQEQLAAAGGDQSVASLALHGLGKICGAPAEMYGPREQISDAKAITFYQAALIVDPQNFLAANELGVLLARCGRLDDAKLALEHAVAYSRAATPLRNLSAVYRRIGEPQRAALAQSEFRRAAEQLVSAGKVGAGDKYPIDWVDTETFARHHSMINSPSITSAVQPAGLSQAESKKQPAVRR